MTDPDKREGPVYGEINWPEDPVCVVGISRGLSPPHPHASRAAGPGRKISHGGAITDEIAIPVICPNRGPV